MKGYEQIPAVPLDRDTAVPTPVPDAGAATGGARPPQLAARGLDEAVTFSFISAREAELFGGASRTTAACQSDQRRSRRDAAVLLPGLVAAARRNADRGFPDCRAVRGRSALSRRHAGGTGAGRRRRCAPGHTSPQALARAGATRSTFTTSRAMPMAALAAMGAPADSIQVAPRSAGLVPSRAGRQPCARAEGAGAFGELHPAVIDALDVKAPAVAFEVFLDDGARCRRRGDDAAAAPPIGVSAGRARLRLCRRP